MNQFSALCSNLKIIVLKVSNYPLFILIISINFFNQLDRILGFEVKTSRHVESSDKPDEPRKLAEVEHPQPEDARLHKTFSLMKKKLRRK